MNKPRVYWCWYPKLGRGFWRVRPVLGRRSHPRDWPLRREAYALVDCLNVKLEREGKVRP